MPRASAKVYFINGPLHGKVARSPKLPPSFVFWSMPHDAPIVYLHKNGTEYEYSSLKSAEMLEHLTVGEIGEALDKTPDVDFYAKEWCADGRETPAG